jgi:hypothetical protein
VKLNASDGAEGDNYGCSVAIDGDRVVVGSYFDDDDGIDSDSAYVYRLTISPDTAIQNVISDIEDMDLPDAMESSLIPKLQGALASLEKGNNKTAMNKINALINEIEAQSGKKIPVDVAENLIIKGYLINEAILEVK